ncbi:hypothetical protein GT755_04185 [Herbidospora sp. NEAU-GS84]|uniref:Uncharacterized protein n=1 Tax=Herbidospora solisilvae TaxID=2696284 RepID=A0A7C9JBT4_9ACTN|nr:hypothetical protein [Herbidospora solisilvae]NAS20883.1 hypothetical protein [Herbidospora solisilvae]
MVVKHVLDGDPFVRQDIEQFFVAIGEDVGLYDLELARLGGLALLGDPATDQPRKAPTRQNTNIRQATAARLRKIKKELVAGVRVNTAEQRSLDRLAWVLANLKASRECVAVVTLLENEIRLFANAADAGLGADFKRLFDLAMEGRREAADDISAMFDEMVAQKMEVRRLKNGKLPPDVLRRGERRLRKTLDYLASLEKQWDDLRVMTHEAAHGMKIHAETQAGDVLLRQRASALGEEAGWSDDEDLTKREAALQDKINDGRRARLSRRLTDAKIAIGISKLCCFKCWLMIQALRAKGITLTPSGTHAKTYNSGWPAPASLARPSLLRAFLQIPSKAEARTNADEYLLTAMSTPDGRAAIMAEIVSFTEEGQKDSGYDSSGDEADLDMTLWRDYYGDEEAEVETAPTQPEVVVERPALVVEPDMSEDDEDEDDQDDQDHEDDDEEDVVSTRTADMDVQVAAPVGLRRSARNSGVKLPDLIGSAYPAEPGEARFSKRKNAGGEQRKTTPKRRKTKR